MKKKLIIFIIAMLCLLALGGGTLAYFTASGTARNVISSGGIRVEVVEQQLLDGTLQPYPSKPIQIMPGTSVSKIVSARSLEQSAWIRMSYSLTVSDASGRKLDIPAGELAKAININHDSSKWTEKNGWWYYGEAAGSGQATTPLFDTVSFSGPDMGNEYQNCTLVIDVTVQAVQQANNGSTVMEALGWPEA